MKMKFFALLLAIVISASFVGCRGYQMKKELINPLGLEEYMEKSVFELPFLAYTDEQLMFYIEFAVELLQSEPSEPEFTEPTDESTLPTQPSEPTTPPTTNPTQPTQPSFTEPTIPSETQPTVPPTTQAPKPTNPPDPVETPTFDFPEDRVAESWFENTLFIGDSRMEGLRLYARSGNAHYFCQASLNFSSVWKQKIGDKGHFNEQKLEQLLSTNRYDKIIVNLGLNDAGNGERWFKTYLGKFMTKVRELQPDAKIILNGIMPVTKRYIEKSKYGGPYWEPDNLKKLDSLMEAYANGTDIFYIDCNPYFADSKGYLFQSVTKDGCHPTPTHYKTWKEWMTWAFTTLGI